MAKLKIGKPVLGPVKLHLNFYVKKGKVADLSNYLKNLEQALEGVIYRNDNQVEEIIAKRIEHSYLEGVEVIIYV